MTEEFSFSSSLSWHFSATVDSALNQLSGENEGLLGPLSPKGMGGREVIHLCFLLFVIQRTQNVFWFKRSLP